MTLKVFAAAAAALALAAIGAAWAQDDQFPETPGKADFLQVCTQCHLPGLVAERRRDPAEWAEVVGRMRDFGAIGTAAEFEAVLAYLNTNFGAESAPATAPTPQKEANPDAR